MKRIESLTELQEYLDGVWDRAQHHAPEVRDAIPHLFFCVCHYADLKSIYVRTYGGATANILWFNLRTTGEKFCFRYEHNGKVIELRERSHLGPVIADFTNVTDPAAIRDVFLHLGSRAEAA